MFDEHISLDFFDAPTTDLSHPVHPFAAKFPPALASWAIRELSHAGDVVLDPMAGSGTALVEACLAGRRALGADIDPLARLLCNVKTTVVAESDWQHATAILLDRFGARMRSTRALPWSYKLLDLPVFEGRDYWFDLQVSHALAQLLHAIDDTPCSPAIRRALYVVFSSMIIAKGTSGLSNALDLAHSRPHKAPRLRPPDTEGVLRRRIVRVGMGLTRFARAEPVGNAVVLEGATASQLPLRDASIDLVVTSPPYINALDYPRAHKFSLWWLAERLGTSSSAYLASAPSYIGSASVPSSRELNRLGVDVIDEAILTAAPVNRKRAAIAHKYFSDMLLVLAEMRRVLRNGGRAALVVAPSTINGTAFPTEEAIRGLAASALVSKAGDGLFVDAMLRRDIDPARRQLPYLRGRNGTGMKQEFVVLLARCITHGS